jgi:hypothetical protein
MLPPPPRVELLVKLSFPLAAIFRIVAVERFHLLVAPAQIIFVLAFTEGSRCAFPVAAPEVFGEPLLLTRAATVTEHEAALAVLSLIVFP